METYSSLINAYNLANCMEDNCDVARYEANTAIMVIKVIPNLNGLRKTLFIQKSFMELTILQIKLLV
jgi:hypothetical protein